jgi:hypothetical protein
MVTVYDRARPRSETTLRVEHLLGRYPNLSEQELAELINLFPHVDMVARGLLAADDRMRTNVDAFYRDHSAKLDTLRRRRTTVIAVVALLAILIGFSLA